jgi:hypothetical protein
MLKRRISRDDPSHPAHPPRHGVQVGKRNADIAGMRDEPMISDLEVGIPGRPRLCDDQREKLPLDRIAEIRKRIVAGVYDSPAVIDAVARGLARSIDL